MTKAIYIERKYWKGVSTSNIKRPARTIDLTRPEFIIVIPLLSLLLCELFFFSLPVFVILNGLFAIILFVIFCYIFMFCFGVLGKRKCCMESMLEFKGRESKILKPFVINSWLFSFFLVILFSQKFGFLAIFTDSHLLQNNAIINSAGNFLHLNIVLMPLFLLLLVKLKTNKYKYLMFFFLSLFFLYFAGIKGYLFQSILLSFFLLASGMRTYKVILFGGLGTSFFFGYFLYYDLVLDLAASNTQDSLERFLAYFSGSWATAGFYLSDNWEGEYPGIMVLSSLYKLFTFGQVSGELFYRFYDVNGFSLNVIPFFQQAYVEGGFVLQLLCVYLVSFIYSLLRLVTFKFRHNLYFEISYVYFCTTLVFSMFFSNILSAMTFAISISTVLLMGLLSMFVNR